MSSKGSSKSSITLGGSTTTTTNKKTSSGTSTSPPPTSPRGSVASGIKSKSTISFSTSTSTPTTPSLSSPSLSSLSSSSLSSSPPPVRITSSVSSNSFQYWKEKESVTSLPSSPSSQSPVATSPKLSANNNNNNIASSNSTPLKSSTTTNSSPKKSIFSLGKKSSLSSSPPTTTSPIVQSSTPATISSGTKVSFINSNNKDSNGLNSNGNNQTNNSNGIGGNNHNLNNPQLVSSTLPNRMNNRKSLKNPLNIFSLDFWSNKNEDNNMGNADESLNTQQEQSNDSQKTNVTTTTTTTTVNKTTPPATSPILTSSTTPSKSKSTIGISQPSTINNTTTTTNSNNNNSVIKKSFISNSNSGNSSPPNTSPTTVSPSIPIKQNTTTNVSATTTTTNSTGSGVKLSPSTKSNSLNNASIAPRKNSSSTTTTTSSSSSSSTTVLSTPTTPIVKPNLIAPKKVSPILQSTTTTTNSNTTSTTTNNIEDISLNESSPTLNGSGSNIPLATSYDSNLPFDPEEMSLTKLKSKINKSDFERLVNLEFYTRVLAKDLEDVTSKLLNETSMRKELESHTKELEARLRISEARLKRYSTMPPPLSSGESSPISTSSTTSPIIPSSPNVISTSASSSSSSMPPPLPPRSYLNLMQAEKEQMELEETEISRAKEEREDQRYNSILVRMEQLEKKVGSLEQRNSQLLEEIHLLQTENQLLNPDRKKTLKKLEKEKEKEMERLQREREKEMAKEKEKEKQRQKDQLKLQKEKEKELQKQQQSSQLHHSQSQQIESNSSTAIEYDDSDDDNINSAEDIKFSNNNNKQRKDSIAPINGLAGDLSPQKKNVVFNDGKSTTKSSNSYLSSVTLRKNTAKRMSAHYTSTTQSSFDDDSSVDDNQSTTSEKVKAIFHDIYDGNIEEMKNHKLTRMRSKSLSKDAGSSGSIDEEDMYQSQPSSAAKLNFSNSASSINATLSLTKDNIPITLCTSLDTNVPPQPTITTTSSSSPNSSSPTSSPIITSVTTPPPTSKPDAMEKIKHLTIGRMSSKKKPGYKDAQLQLSEKLNHRASKNELIFKNIIKAESIFGIALAEDTSDRLMDYLNKSIEYLLDHSVIDGLFSIEIEESKLKPTIEHIENTLITDFSLIVDPHLVSSTFIYYFSKLPTLLLSKISNQLIHSIEIPHDEYRRNVIRSLLYSLPLQNRNILKMVLQFLKKYRSVSKANGGTNGSSEDEEDLEIISAYNRFAKAMINTTPGTMDQASKSIRFLVNDIDEFDKQQQDIQYMVKDGESIVKAASFDRLVEKLFDLSYGFKDPDYNYTIFHTYDYYTSSCELLEKFIQYYRIACTLTPTKLQMEMSITVLSVAMFWMKIHHNHLMTDLAFLQKLKVFIDSNQQQVPPNQNTYFTYFASFFKPTLEPLKPLYERGNSFLGPNLTQSSGTSKKKNQLIEKMKMNNAQNNANNIEIDIYAIGSNIIAQQITVIDNEMLMAIPPSQFLHKAFTKYQQSPQFHDMVSKFNEWARWTSSEILSKEKLADRVNALSYFIDLAKNCVELGNYNAANAIVGGLNHSSISRLKLTWEKLSKQVSQDYDRLESLFDLSMNYKNYREEIKSTKAKIIPYLGLFPKDLIAIEEGNDNFTSTNLINTEKFRLLYGTIKKIQSYQQPLFNIKSSEPIKLYLRNISNNLFDEKEFHSISQKIEPRQSTN